MIPKTMLTCAYLVALSTLLYNCEAWLTDSHVSGLRSFYPQAIAEFAEQMALR